MENQNIYFRASGIGALMTDGRGTTLTDNMKKEYEDFKERLRNGGKLTDPQKLKFEDYKKRENAPFQLSDTAKTFVKKTWLFNEKGFRKDVKSPFLEKGLYNESEAIAFLSKMDGNFYKKNTERKFKDNITGECDINFKSKTTRIIIDTKCSWDAETYMNGSLDNLYFGQGQSYCDLYDADEFWLRFVLLDCPDHIFNKQREMLWNKYYDHSMTIEEAQELETKMEPLFEQLERNLIFSKSGKYTDEERVKTIKVQRDDEYIKELRSRIKPALNYYSTIKLNDVV